MLRARKICITVKYLYGVLNSKESIPSLERSNFLSILSNFEESP